MSAYWGYCIVSKEWIFSTKEKVCKLLENSIWNLLIVYIAVQKKIIHMEMILESQQII